MSKTTRQAALLNTKTMANKKNAGGSMVNGKGCKEDEIQLKTALKSDYKPQQSMGKENSAGSTDHKLFRRKLPDDKNLQEKLKTCPKSSAKDPSSRCVIDGKPNSESCGVKPNKSDGGKNGKKNGISKSRGSTAAMVLGNSADGLASSPSKAGRLHATADVKHSNVAKALRKMDVKPSIKVERQVSFEKVTHSIKQIQTKQSLLNVSSLKSSSLTASPTLSKIPNDLVRKMVHNIQV